MKPDGGSLIGFGSSVHSGEEFSAYEPARGGPVEPKFISANREDVARAAQLAAESAPVWAKLVNANRSSTPRRDRNFLMYMLILSLKNNIP